MGAPVPEKTRKDSDVWEREVSSRWNEQEVLDGNVNRRHSLGVPSTADSRSRIAQVGKRAWRVWDAAIKTTSWRQKSRAPILSAIPSTYTVYTSITSPGKDDLQFMPLENCWVGSWGCIGGTIKLPESVGHPHWFYLTKKKENPEICNWLKAQRNILTLCSWINILSERRGRDYGYWETEGKLPSVCSVRLNERGFPML